MSTDLLLSKLRKLNLSGMADALAHQLSSPPKQQAAFTVRLADLIEAEQSSRCQRALQRFLRASHLPQLPSVSGLDYARTKGLLRTNVQEVAQCRWIELRQNIVVTGPTGVGKTFLALALAREVLLQGHTAQYFKLPDLIQRVRVEKSKSAHARFRKRLSKTALLVLDDFLIHTSDEAAAQELRQILDDREGFSSTLIVSTHAVREWHQRIEDDTLADGILDRLVNGAFVFDLDGDSKRRLKSSCIGTSTKVVALPLRKAKK